MSTLGRNTLYNLAGFAIPLLLFVVTIPVYISLIGAARYGVLAIVWLVLGLFGMMDLGLGRAANQRISSLKDGSDEERRTALGSALLGNAAVGFAGALIMGGVAYYTFAHAMQLEPELRAEAIPLAWLMALGVPILTTIAVLNGALMARERFLAVNRITIANMTVFQLLPLLVAWLNGPELFPLVLAALAGRALAVGLLLVANRREFGSHVLRSADKSVLWSMLKYGGWVTLGGMVGMVLVFADRFAIGAAIGAVAVTIYAVPLDATRRIAVLADSLANALFPRLATSDAEQSAKLSAQAVGALYAVATPPVAVLIVLADPLMRLWLGEEIGAQSAPLLQILAIAGWANIFAKVPYARLQAQGRPDVVTKIMIAQLPFFIGGLWWALGAYGLAGAAWVYLARNTVDTLALFWFADRGVARWRFLFVTFAAMVAATILLPPLAPLPWVDALAMAVPVGLFALGLSWIVAPPRMREIAGSLLRRLPFMPKSSAP